MNIGEQIKIVEDDLEYLKYLKSMAPKGYCERLRNHLDGNFERRQYKIIDYDGTACANTVTVLFPKTTVPYGVGINGENLIKSNLIIQRMFAVRNGLIVAFHFRD